MHFELDGDVLRLADEVTVSTFTGEIDSDATTRGYMFTFKRVDKDFASSMENTIVEFTDAHYEDLAMGVSRRGMARGWGMNNMSPRGLGINPRAPFNPQGATQSVIVNEPSNRGSPLEQSGGTMFSSSAVQRPNLYKSERPLDVPGKDRKCVSVRRSHPNHKL